MIKCQEAVIFKAEGLQTRGLQNITEDYNFFIIVIYFNTVSGKMLALTLNYVWYVYQLYYLPQKTTNSATPYLYWRITSQIGARWMIFFFLSFMKWFITLSLPSVHIVYSQVFGASFGWLIFFLEFSKSFFLK